MSAQLLQFPQRIQPLPWYGCQVLPSHEFRVRERFEDAKVEHYLPSKFRKGFRDSKVEYPIFPGYVFARGIHLDLYAICRPTRWLIKVIGDWRGPIEIPPVQIESLRLALAQADVIVMTVDRWHGGEEVTVTSGPMAGAVGTVVYVKNQTRLVISVPMLGRCVSTELDADAVKELVLPKAA